MTSLFADTHFYLALMIQDDAAHPLATEYSEARLAPVVTTAWVLTEVGDALCHDPHGRRAFVRLLELLDAAPDVTVVPATQELFGRGVELFASRPDKEWSLNDCISFVV